MEVGEHRLEDSTHLVRHSLVVRVRGDDVLLEEVDKDAAAEEELAVAVGRLRMPLVSERTLDVREDGEQPAACLALDRADLEVVLLRPASASAVPGLPVGTLGQQLLTAAGRAPRHGGRRLT